MTTLSDGDILEKLKLFQEKVDGINIKTKENILTSSEIQETSIDIDIESIKKGILYFLYFLYFCIPICISVLLVYFKPDIVMTETKIDNFFTKLELSYYKVITATIINFIIFTLFFIFVIKK
jgi:hypothetical protein